MRKRFKDGICWAAVLVLSYSGWNTKVWTKASRMAAWSAAGMSELSTYSPILLAKFDPNGSTDGRKMRPFWLLMVPPLTAALST